MALAVALAVAVDDVVELRIGITPETVEVAVELAVAVTENAGAKGQKVGK